MCMVCSHVQVLFLYRLCTLQTEDKNGKRGATGRQFHHQLGECFQKAFEATERLRSDLAQIKSVGMTG